jgi:hypothetical protein
MFAADNLHPIRAGPTGAALFFCPRLDFDLPNAERMDCDAMQ